jgi:large conductance mechanosensitive channel
MEPESKTSFVDRLGKPIKHVNPFLKEFRDFAMRGNVIDLAVGVIIGAAFGKIIDSLVTNVVMPPLSILTGNIDLSDRVIILSRQTYPDLAAAKAAHAPMITYGIFLNSVISFFLVSFTIFICVRTINKLHRKVDPPPAPPTKDCPFCCSSIPLLATRCPQCTSTLQPAALPGSKP